jgi:hypothetical protein
MSFVHGRAYQPDHVWTNDELLAVTPEIIVWYIKIKVYGSENAQPDVQPPLNYQSSTILFGKRHGPTSCLTRLHHATKFHM